MKNTYEGLCNIKEALKSPEGKKAIREIRRKDKEDRIASLGLKRSA
jgi:hypothetical protein